MELLNKYRDIFTSSQTDTQRQITAFYNAYKHIFIAYIRRINPLIDEMTAQDIYQESFLAMYEAVRDGNQIELINNPGAYLLGIGRKKAYKFFHKQNNLPETNSLEDFPEIAEEDTEVSNLKQEIVHQSVTEMDERCKEILFLYYWHRKKIHEIAAALNYTNEVSAKNRKSACMKKLKIVLIEKFKIEGLIL